MSVDVQQRVSKLKGLLARVQERRQLARPAQAEAAQVSRAASAPPPPPLDLDEYDDVLDLADDEIVEIGDSVPPPQAEPAAASRPQPSPALTSTEPPLPQAVEPEPSQRSPEVDVFQGWASSVPPKPESTGAQRDEVSEAPANEVSQPTSARRTDYGLDFDALEDEDAPASSRRPIASSMDEALADAAAREGPLKTPPPESGPQESSLPASAGHSPTDESLPGASEADMLSKGLPTSAQLGNTVPLEEGEQAEFEVHAPSEPAVADSMPPSEDFEIRLPARDAGGSYDANLEAPPGAQLELEAHRKRASKATEDVKLATPAASSIPSALQQARPEADVEVVERPVAALSTDVSEVTSAPQRFRPGSFVELLEASLKLGQG